MHNRINEEKILVIAAVALVVFLTLSLSFFFVFIDRGFYDKSFSKYGAYDKIGIEGVRTTMDHLIKYLISDSPSEQTKQGISVFTPKEISHLKDVHKMFIWLKYISLFFGLSLITILFRLKAKKLLNKTAEKMALYAAITNTAILVIIILLSLNFNWLFVEFHAILFPQGNWTFPADSLLITLFPQEFFQDFLKKVLFHTTIITLILYFLATNSNFFVWKKK